MSTHIFLLDKTDLAMSVAEVLALAQTEKHELVEHALICDYDSKLERLALTRMAGKLLFETTPEKLDEDMKAFSWKDIYFRHFSIDMVRVAGNVAIDKKKLAEHVWNAVYEPAVNIKHAKTKILLFVVNNRILVTQQAFVQSEEFRKRRAHLLPEKHPTAMNPKLARACINLTGMQTGGVLTDPFCGLGGVLIEAGLMRFNTKGYDISKSILVRCQKNLEHYKIKRFQLEERDATKLTTNEEYIVTDLPYGRGSKISEPPAELYEKFIIVLDKILKHKATIIFPDTYDYHPAFNKTALRIEHEFSSYVHKNLTRKIVVVGHR